jgi:hypothetical protein
MCFDHERLKKFILENSESSNLEEAWREWKPVNHNRRLRNTNIIGHWYSHCSDSHCRCGNKIDYCYQIKNMKTGLVFPKEKYSSVAIGSECIKKFLPEYKFSTYKHKTQLCITCNNRYKENCKTCQINLLRGISYCINVECKREINDNTKKKYGNKKCRKCNEASL